MEAVSESCADHYEESKTDVNGQFRIMGLNPGCNYDLKVKSPGSYVVSPENIEIDVIDSDKRNIEFQAFKCMDFSFYQKILFPSSNFSDEIEWKCFDLSDMPVKRTESRALQS